MANHNQGKGISRKKKGYLLKNTSVTPPTLTISTGTTSKQNEVLSYLLKGKNPGQIARELNLNRNSVIDRLKGCIKKNLVSYEHNTYYLTNNGYILAKNLNNDVTGGVTGRKEKNQHTNNFTVKLQRLPYKWSHNSLFLQSLTEKKPLHNTTTKTAILYYDECTVKINYGKKAKSVEFFVIIQKGSSVDHNNSSAWDVFVKYYNIVSSNGFDLGIDVTSRDPHFANPNGFFAMLSSKLTNKGFSIQTDDVNFWVDYSDGFPEEETDNIDHARRLEELADSTIGTSSTFYDVDKMSEYFTIFPSYLAKNNLIINKTVKVLGTAVELVKSNVSFNNSLQKQLSILAQSQKISQEQINGLAKSFYGTNNNQNNLNPNNDIAKEKENNNPPYYVR